MFRRRKQWHPFGDFPTSSIQRLPFQRHDEENKILYTTRYEADNEEKCGIFEYDIDSKENKAIKLWSNINYYPRWDVTVYNPSLDSIVFVGGADVKKQHQRLEYLIIYNLEDDIVQKIKIPHIIGGNARICLSDGDNFLHIIGGTSNAFHLLFDFRDCLKMRDKLKCIHSFSGNHSQIQSCGLIYSSLTNELVMFGGRSSAQHLCFDDFFVFDLKHNLAKKSMNECCSYLINGWIKEQIYTKTKEIWPLDLNDVILKFLGIQNTINNWQKIECCSLPIGLYQFGYVLYRERIILTFGGRNEGNECVDNIFYFDLLNKCDGWKECKIKCPKASTYNALLMEGDDIVHIVPFYVDKDHFSIPINKLLPKQLIQQINIDIIVKQQNDFGVEYEIAMEMQQRNWMNKIILSVLIGIIVVIIGLILYFIHSLPQWIGIVVFVIGVLMIFSTVLCQRLFKPKESEYLLF